LTHPGTALAERRLLDHAGEIFSEATGARRGGEGFRGDEVQVFVVGDLVKVVPVLQQLPAQVLVHLLGWVGVGNKGGRAQS